MLKETIIHETYKDGKYTDEPSSLFLYIEEKKKYAGVYCYFLPFYKNYKNIVIVKKRLFYKFWWRWIFSLWYLKSYFEDLNSYSAKVDKKIF